MASAWRSSSSRCAGSAPHAHRRTFPSRLSLEPQLPSVLGEQATALFWVAATLMALGVWLHVTERHEHRHVHGPLEHAHVHVHDEHHQHEHDLGFDGGNPHSHPHRHSRLVHSHPHYPDLHHRHEH